MRVKEWVTPVITSLCHPLLVPESAATSRGDLDAPSPATLRKRRPRPSRPLRGPHCRLTFETRLLAPVSMFRQPSGAPVLPQRREIGASHGPGDAPSIPAKCGRSIAENDHPGGAAASRPKLRTTGERNCLGLVVGLRRDGTAERHRDLSIGPRGPIQPGRRIVPNPINLNIIWSLEAG